MVIATAGRLIRALRIIGPYRQKRVARPLRRLDRRSALGCRHAALMFAIYGTVCVAILQVRVPDLSTTEYVLYIFAGLVPYLMMAEAIGTSVTSVIASPSVWTNTVFPVDLASTKCVLLSQVSMVAGFSVVVRGVLVMGALRWTVLPYCRWCGCFRSWPSSE
jgi:ABC-type polysaccharide/polyol phosphate export permease